MSSLQRSGRVGELRNDIHPMLRFRVLRVVLFTRRLHSRSDQKELKFSPPCHTIFKYLIPTLIGLLAMKYQGKATNPFDTHPLNMWAFFTSTCIYCLVLGFMKETQGHRWERARRYSQILGHVILTSGTLSSVSLATVFLPLWFGLLFVIVWAVLMSRRLLAYTFQLLCEKIMKAIFYVLNTFSRIIEGRLMEEQDSVV